MNCGIGGSRDFKAQGFVTWEVGNRDRGRRSAQGQVIDGVGGGGD